MPILLVFALIAACLPIEWPPPPVGPEREAALALSGGAVATAFGLALALRGWVIRTVRRDPLRRYEVARAYNRWRRGLFFVNLAVSAACVLAFGWGWLVQSELLIFWDGEARLVPFGELAVPLPYFVLLVGGWLIYYDAERALHRVLHLGERPFWSRSAYLLYNLRQFALMVMLPVLLWVTQQALARYLPEITRTLVYKLGSLAVVPGLILLMPLLMKPLLGLRPMPPGPVRDRFVALARRLEFRCADFLLWPTHGAIANAFITGLLPRVRYVVFTDRILDDLPPDELDAVLGHEVGHARHGHIWLYAGFLALSLSVLAALVLFVEQVIETGTSGEVERLREVLKGFKTWAALPPVVLVTAYLFVVFGALSRWCERQADLFGCRAMSCADPTCTGHDEKTVYATGGRCLCPTGIRTFARALDRVRDLNGLDADEGGRHRLGRAARAVWGWLRAWQHGPMSRRIAYLSDLATRPHDERRFQRRLFALKWVLMLSLLAALVVLGQAVGWRALLEVL
ncbi:M48 family metallopeptidase [Gemmata sp. JC673]|uniref:M48 family metallopeptidase n=1 Tax=Gemmata algarum TaxID=2975278 RepID=A0ABU5ES93_9BACT|nr:M48 family metallopeptidase [Gemmata algarum]MDY3557824.1 M48 family metallopeptidase [Gemmata algarum]